MAVDMIRVAQNGPPPHKRRDAPAARTHRAVFAFDAMNLFVSTWVATAIILFAIRSTIRRCAFIAQQSRLIFKICANFTLMRLAWGYGVCTDCELRLQIIRRLGMIKVTDYGHDFQLFHKEGLIIFFWF